MGRPRTRPDLPESKVCEECGEGFSRPRVRPRGPVTHAQWQRQRYCGDVCRRAAQGERMRVLAAEGRHPATKPDVGFGAHRARARKLYRAKGRPCEICRGDATDVHHRDEAPSNNDPTNIAFLCRSCHTRLHASSR